MNKLLHGICSCCIWCSVLLAIFSTVDLYAQTQIAGKVVDSSGEPVLGATVTYDGGKKGTATGLDGTFRIDAATGSEIMVSFIGYQNTYAKLTPNMVITMKEDETAIDEVVVVGYGSIKSKEMTGSVGVVNMDDLEDVAMTSIDQALEGRVTGLQVISSDGSPGSEASIVIRGVGSMDDAGPLFVIDGFPQEESDFTSLNPDDIESMTVLKDASSTAIYGSRGANGVILITTKRGKEGKPTITYNGSLALHRITKEMEVMDAYQFVKLQEDLTDALNYKRNTGVTSGTANNNDWLDSTYQSGGRTSEDYKNPDYSVDWMDWITNDTPLQQTHTISMSGRKDNSGYYVSMNIADQVGLIMSSGFTRYQGRVSLDQSITDNIKLGFTANFATTTTQSVSEVMNRVYQARPTSWDKESFDLLINEFIDDGVYDEATQTNTYPYPTVSNTIELKRIHPIIEAENSEIIKVNDVLSANAYLEMNLWKKDLVLKVSGGYTNRRTTSSSFYQEETNSGHPDINDKGVNGSLSESLGGSLLQENTLTYKKVIKKSHSINAVLGFSIQQTTSQGFGYTAEFVPEEELGIAGLENGTITATTSSGSINSMLSMFARMNYSYKSKYTFTGTIRRDGSSKFAIGNKWGTFPSAAFAWRFMEENFMKDYKKYISDAKLRVSYGMSGNNRVNDFQSQGLITSSKTYRYTFGNTLNTYGSYPSQMYNGDLTWETAETFNAGAELSFLKNKIKVEFDYYIKTTHDILNSSTLPTNSGYSSVKRNAGEIRNSGYEIALNTTNINKGGFRWTSTFNISFNENKLMALSSGEEAKITTLNSTEAYIARVGEPVAKFYGYISDGWFQYDDFIALESTTTYEKTDGTISPITRYILKDNIATADSRITTLPGYSKYKDINGDGTIDDNDRTVIGSPYPKHIGSLMNRFSYKGINLSIYFTYSYGAEVWNATMMQMWNVVDMRSYGINRFEYLADYWTDDNPNARYPMLVASGLRNMSSNYLEDASYLRLKTLSISYSLPKKWVAKLGLSQVRVSYSGNNLWTLTKYQGQDPEVNVSYTALTPGYDNNTYPRTSTNSIGLNITL
ncbi:MAG: TonB-dependent receptor [Rikenellaceae bacterium]